MQKQLEHSEELRSESNREQYHTIFNPLKFSGVDICGQGM